MQGQALSGNEVERVREAFHEAMRADDFDKARTLAKLHATLRRDQRAREARQASEGVKTLALGYVAFWPDRPGQRLASKVVHADRDCYAIREIPDDSVREATAEERQRVRLCQICGD